MYRSDSLSALCILFIALTMSLAAPSVTPLPENLKPHDRPTPAPGNWFVQVGAFADHENAYRLATTLENAGYPLALVPKHVNGRELLCVRVGGYPTREDCRDAAHKLKTQHHLPVLIVLT